MVVHNFCTDWLSKEIIVTEDFYAVVDSLCGVFFTVAFFVSRVIKALDGKWY